MPKVKLPKPQDLPSNYILEADRCIREAVLSEDEGRLRRAKKACQGAILRLELAQREAQLRLARLSARDSAARSLARRW